jgi:hypothetical protein
VFAWWQPPCVLVVILLYDCSHAEVKQRDACVQCTRLSWRHHNGTQNRAEHLKWTDDGKRALLKGGGGGDLIQIVSPQNYDKILQTLVILQTHGSRAAILLIWITQCNFTIWSSGQWPWGVTGTFSFSKRKYYLQPSKLRLYTSPERRYVPARCHNPADHKMNIQCSENLNAYDMKFVSLDSSKYSIAHIHSWEADNRVHCVFTRYRLWVLPWPIWIQSVSSHPVYLRSISISLHLPLCRSRGLFTSGLSN